jgi:hypothetical protein
LGLINIKEFLLGFRIKGPGNNYWVIVNKGKYGRNVEINLVERLFMYRMACRRFYEGESQVYTIKWVESQVPRLAARRNIELWKNGRRI